MVRIRAFEEQANQLYLSAKMPGLTHMYVGQEAVAVGICEALTPNDKITSTHRGHGHCVAKGADFKQMFCELLGKQEGYCRGKGGSMHMFSREKGFFGGHGIVAAQVPIGAGLVFSHKYNGNKNVSITYFGDGAANQGQVYESYNIASLWKLPVVFVIENNKYGMGTSVNRSSAGENLSDRGKPYGIMSEIVDGMDILAVREAAIRAIDYCRSGKGPYILEMKTYRYRGHSLADPDELRSEKEKEFWGKRDPIKKLAEEIIDGKFATEEELKSIEKRIDTEISESVKNALEAPEPPSKD